MSYAGNKETQSKTIFKTNNLTNNQDIVHIKVFLKNSAGHNFEGS